MEADVYGFLWISGPQLHTKMMWMTAERKKEDLASHANFKEEKPAMERLPRGLLSFEHLGLLLNTHTSDGHRGTKHYHLQGDSLPLLHISAMFGLMHAQTGGMKFSSHDRLLTKDEP